MGLNLAAAVFLLSLTAASAPAQDADRTPAFGGARLGMLKSQLEALPVFDEREPGCGRLVLPDRPRTQVETCVAEIDDGETHFLLAPDQEGQFRLLHIFALGHADGADEVMDGLFRRFGAPRVVNGITQPESIDVTADPLVMTWIYGAQRVVFRRPCEGAVDYCIEYSDSPYGRRLARSAGASVPTR